ncbi:MAG: ribonuclease III [Pseudomonadota bacterium]
MTPAERLQDALEYRFKQPALLVQALSHRSTGPDNYERLEYLGDGLLNFVIAEAVFQARPLAEEGELSRLRAALVREESLARIAARLALGDALKLGGGEMKSGGYRRDSILADALEAVIGAAYLDGGFEPARTMTMRLFAPLLGDLPEAASLKDPKTRLQEWLQGRGRPLPEYRLLSAEGPSHQQTFTVACELADGDETTQAQGSSRKLAEQKAAESMLNKMEVTHA